MTGGEPEPERLRHVASLDGVRGIAVVLVMLLHYEVRRFQLHFPGAGLVRKGVEFGWAGVDLFFVLSGFLITGILWDAKERPHYYRNFFARRALRIFPLLFAFLLLVFIVLPARRKDGTGDKKRAAAGLARFVKTIPGIPGQSHASGLKTGL